jgi:hypothetical protein
MNARAYIPGNAGHHAVQFYRDDDRLRMAVADFIGDGIAAGQPTLIIATAEHRQLILADLTRRKFAVEALRQTGSLRVLDAHATLDQLMTGNRIDAARFREVAAAAIPRLGAADREPIVRAFGEMVDVLWRQGNRDAAIRLETLWNDLARTHAFSLMCGYGLSSFADDESIRRVSSLHTHVHH